MYYCNFSFLLWWAKLVSCLWTSLLLRIWGNNLKAVAQNSIKVFILWGRLRKLTHHHSPLFCIPGQRGSPASPPLRCPRAWWEVLAAHSTLTPAFFHPFSSGILELTFESHFLPRLFFFINILCMCCCQTGIDLPNKRTLEIHRVRSIFNEKPTKH